MTNEELREMCAKIADDFNDFMKEKGHATSLAAETIAEGIRAIQLPEQEPVAYLKFRAWQTLDTNGYCDGETGLEVCEKYDIGDDKSLAFPVYVVPSSVEALENKLANANLALNEWLDKTEWVQKTAQPKELGKHRADVLTERITVLEKQVEELTESLLSALQELNGEVSHNRQDYIQKYHLARERANEYHF